MPEPSALETIVGSPRYERFMSGQQSVIDLRNVAAVAAQIQGWWPAFDELLNGKVDYLAADGNARVIDFARKIKSARQIDDPTSFRRYFTVLSVVEFLAGKFSAEFQAAQKTFNGVTAQTVMHYANISVSDAYNCLVWLAREGLVTRQKTHDLLEWITFSERMGKEEAGPGLLAKLETEEKREIAKFKKEEGQELKKLRAIADNALAAMKEVDGVTRELYGRGAVLAHYDTEVIERHLANLEAARVEKQSGQLEQISKAFAERKSALKIEVTQEERELWEFRKSLPQYAYAISPLGRQLLENARQKYAAGSHGFANILREVDKRISGMGLLHRPTSCLGLAHILEEKLQDISFGVHREMLNEWSQLPEERVLLFMLYSGPFVFDFGDRQETRNLSYIGPKTEGSSLLAKVYVDGEDRLLARNGAVSVLGFLSMAESDAEGLKAMAASAFAGLMSSGPSQRYGQVLRDHMRYGSMMLAPTESERAHCNRLGITHSDARPIVFDVQGVESVKLIGENTRVEIPESLAGAYTILFLPKFFDRKGIRFRLRP